MGGCSADDVDLVPSHGDRLRRCERRRAAHWSPAPFRSSEGAVCPAERGAGPPAVSARSSSANTQKHGRGSRGGRFTRVHRRQQISDRGHVGAKAWGGRHGGPKPLQLGSDSVPSLLLLPETSGDLGGDGLIATRPLHRGVHDLVDEDRASGECNQVPDTRSAATPFVPGSSDQALQAAGLEGTEHMHDLRYPHAVGSWPAARIYLPPWNAWATDTPFLDFPVEIRPPHLLRQLIAHIQAVVHPPPSSVSGWHVTDTEASTAVPFPSSMAVGAISRVSSSAWAIASPGARTSSPRALKRFGKPCSPSPPPCRKAIPRRARCRQPGEGRAIPADRRPFQVRSRGFLGPPALAAHRDRVDGRR